MTETMRALTIRPPWSEAIRYGTKRVENRSWPAPAFALRTVIAIHAGKGFDQDAVFPRGHMTLTPAECALGAVVAVARLASCHDSADCYRPMQRPGSGQHPLCSPWAVRSQWHWVLADVRPLAEPVPYRGALGLWRLPGDVEKAVREQLEASRGAS